MPQGWIRAYDAEDQALKNRGRVVLRSDRSAFRKSFKTTLQASRSQNARALKTLRWGAELALPNGLSTSRWTKATSGSVTGFVRSDHVVEVAYVARRSGATLSAKGGKAKLLWGDLVQITKPGRTRCSVRARGQAGTIDCKALGPEGLLEVYFVDVGQGDGLLVRTPDGRHLLIDGGLERTKQLTGKNAADFVDWKFFQDYGDFVIRLDSLMASHSDSDHYGGLHDLVREGKLAERELDCERVDIKTFHHPGLSRWTTRKNASPPHAQGLGPRASGSFTRLLGDRRDAEKSVRKTSKDQLSGPWGRFVRDVLANDSRTKVQRVMTSRDEVELGDLPELWPARAGCHIRVLGPVSTKVGSRVALPDFKKKSYNTNGHSICLRVDYGRARILLTGDLNTTSMGWLEEAYGDRMGAWECDVAKACHHGSHDISYRFLEAMRPAATIISSGDAEGHAHPRPEIVGASALTGFPSVDRKRDRLRTPLLYMTEIERSVSLGALNRIDFRGLPLGDQAVDGAILARSIDELNDQALLTPEDRKKLARMRDKRKAGSFLRKAAKAQRSQLQPMEEAMRTGAIDVDFNLTVPQGPMGPVSVRKRAWRSRVMEKNHYGLVNVRTDGETILCATLDETEHKWVTHEFPARFEPPTED